MENLSELSGYVASTLVLLTFVAKDMRLLRTAAIFSNLAFIAYGTIEWLPPVLFLHLVLLPLNIARLSEILRAPSNGAVRTQTLCTDVPGPDHTPIAS
jgi:CRP/FNR family transcriptional regulator, cyclic AMP receptor protein